VADKFVRVRLTRVDNLDLNLFEFDYDLTMMIFFLDSEERVYARYGGRDPKDADNRQSLAGLKYTMNSVLHMHGSDKKEYAPKSYESSKSLRDLAGTFRSRGCMHCHQVKEAIDSSTRRNGQWTREQFWRYPLPENVGLRLDVDRGNVVSSVEAKSPVANVGVKPGAVVLRLNDVPVHSFGDVQFGLDRAPADGAIPIVFRQDSKIESATLKLASGWRKTDVSWRTSIHRYMPYARVFGEDLTAAEKKSLGLKPSQLAFRQKSLLTQQAKAAGVLAGDIIIGADDLELEMDAAGFVNYVQRNYFIGETITLGIIRDGKRMKLPMALIR
jgi:hypothetical protein